MSYTKRDGVTLEVGDRVISNFIPHLTGTIEEIHKAGYRVRWDRLEKFVEKDIYPHEVRAMNGLEIMLWLI